MMAEAEKDEFEVETTPGFKPPAEKKLEEIINQDKGDESLENYKKTLIGSGIPDPVFPDDPRVVIVKQLTLKFADHPEVTMALDGDISNLKNNPVVIKEGVRYSVQLHFYVQREIVSGLRYVAVTYRGPLKVDKESKMVGSYGPKKEPHIWTSSEEEAPKGMVSRGSYRLKSKFTDDDGKDYLSWEWAIEIKKDW